MARATDLARAPHDHNRGLGSFGERSLPHTSRAALVTVGLLLLVFDVMTPRGIAAGPLYAILVLLAAGLTEKAIGLTAVAATALIAIGYAISVPMPGVPTWLGPTNCVIGAVVVWVAAWLCIARQRASAAVQQRDALLGGILGSITDSFCAFGKDWRFTFVNDELVRRVGLPREQIVGRHLWEMFPAAMESVAYPEMQRAMSGRIVVEYEAFYEPWQCWFLTRAYPTAEGGLALYTRDITAQKHAADTLRDSEERIRLAVDAAGLGYWSWDLQAHAVTTDARCAALFGLTPETAQTDEAVFARVVPEDLPVLKAGVQAAIDGVAPYDVEFRVLNGDGAVRWLAGKGDVLRDNAGHPVRMAGVNLDVTERVRLEHALRNRGEQFETLLNRAPLGVYLVDADFRVAHINPVAQAAMGIPDAVGRDFEDVVHTVWPTPVAEEIVRIFRRTLATGESYAVPEVADVRADSGALEHHEWRVDRTTLPDGRFGLICYFRNISEHVRRREAIGASEARFRAAVTAVSSLIWTNDASGRMTGEQPGWAAFTGQRFEEYQGYGWSQAVHPDDAAATVAAWEAALAVRGNFAFEHRVRRQDGAYRLCTIRAVPILDGRGEIREWVGVHTDVTEERAAQEQSRLHRQLVESVIHHLPAAVAVLQGPDLTFTLINPAYQALAPGKAMLNRPAAEVWPETHPRFGDRCRRVLRTGEPFHLEDEPYEISRSHGAPLELRQFSWSIDRVTLPGDEQPGALVTVWETTERHRAEQAVRESEERLRLIMTNVKDHAIVTLDRQGLVTSWNVGAERMFGWQPGEMLGQPADVLFTADDRAEGRPFVDLQIAAETGFADNERYHVRKNGGEFFASGSMEGLRDESGDLRGYVKVVRDITEQKRLSDDRERMFEAERAARADAERVGRMKDEFLATLSHELRTPLNAVLGWAQILQQTKPTAKAIGRGLKAIERNAHAQAQLISDLLDTSRITSGKVRLDVRPLSLTEVLEAAVDVVRPAADAKRVTLQTTVDARVGPVSGDHDRLQQVFWNLLSNAVKFTPDGGSVQVVLERVDNHVEVSVIDTGQGITPDFLPHVFERFRQQDGTTTRLHSGLGLGLAIVKHLIELHGGVVRATSEGQGQGATFVVVLPLAPTSGRSPGDVPREPAAPSSRPAQHGESSRLDGLVILAVDDDADAREILRRILEESGARVVTASHAGEALALVATERPDLLVCDIGMPGTDGYEFIRLVRHSPPDAGGRVPAIALTAFARPEDRRRALSAGYQAHMVKPFESGELLAICASLAGLTTRLPSRGSVDQSS